MLETVFAVVLIVVILAIIWFVFKALIVVAIAVIILLTLLFIGNRLFGEEKSGEFNKKWEATVAQIVFSREKNSLHN
ncbi:MAG: hypothetical protein FWE23_04790 [Chitinivibrionia bacterium]|nr:hypothetical protein [Chitinivibrionia bacterium]